MAPPEPPRGFRIEASLLLSTPVDDLGLQAVARGRVEFRAGRYFLARFRLLPGGVSIGRGSNFGTAGATAEIGFDHRFVGASAGVGVERLYDRGDEAWRGDGSWGAQVALPTTFRIGAVDGLMVEATTMLTVRDEQLDFLSFSGRIQVPLINGLWIGAHGAGGPLSALWYSEAYVRVALRGNGFAGTTLLELGAGLMGSTKDTPAPTRTGPSLSLGVVHTL